MSVTLLEMAINCLDRYEKTLTIECLSYRSLELLRRWNRTNRLIVETLCVMSVERKP